MKNMFSIALEHAERADTGVLENPLVLMRYLRGLALGDSRWDAPLGDSAARLASEFRCQLSLDAGSLCYLHCSSRRNAVDRMVDSLGGCLPVVLPAAEMADVVNFFDEIPYLRNRAPMYISGWSATDLLVYFEGYAIARYMAGFPVDYERQALHRMEVSLQDRWTVPGRWDRLLEIMDGGRGRSVVLFCHEFNAVNNTSYFG